MLYLRTARGMYEKLLSPQTAASHHPLSIVRSLLPRKTLLCIIRSILHSRLVFSSYFRHTKQLCVHTKSHSYRLCINTYMYRFTTRVTPSNLAQSTFSLPGRLPCSGSAVRPFLVKSTSSLTRPQMSGRGQTRLLAYLTFSSTLTDWVRQLSLCILTTVVDKTRTTL